jgi:hypothetical protein
VTTKQQRIAAIDPQTREKFSTSAYVVEAGNHLNQKRQFAFDGRYWFYQPSNRDRFQRVSPRDLPANAVSIMANYTGITEDVLRG